MDRHPRHSAGRVFGLDRRPVRRRPAPADTPSRRRLFVCRPRSGARGDGSGVREDDPLDAGAPRLSAAGDRRRRRGAARRSTSDGARRRGASTRASRWRCAPCSPARSSCSASNAIRANVAPDTAYRVSDLELASRLSFFLWSSIPDDELLDVAGAGQAERAGGARAAGAADAGRSALGRARRRTSPASGCTCATCRPSSPDAQMFPGLRRQPAAGVPARNRAVLRQHRARGSQRRSTC